jgi:hypothetical protein
MNQMREGINVRTHARLRDTRGFMIAERHLLARRTDAAGTVLSWVPGHGGDVWWVRHNDGEVAPYCNDEVDEVES